MPGAERVIEDEMREWFEQALVEVVIGVRALRGSVLWTGEDINRALSSEALTAAVLQRYHVDMALRRSLGRELGSLKDKIACARPRGRCETLAVVCFDTAPGF